MQAKESLDPDIKKIILRDLLERQEEIERVRAHNLQLINEPLEYRTHLADRKLIKNQQKVEMIIAFFNKMGAEDR